MLIIAHRGASALAHHENTLESFQIAIDLNADMVEFDIRKTKDEELIVFHDRSLNGKNVSSYTYKEMNEIAALESYHIPKLSEVLALCKGKIYLDVEIKSEGIEQRVIDMITKRYGYTYDSFSIKSFLDDVVLRVKELDGRIRTGLLLGRSEWTVTSRLSEYFPEKRLMKCRADFVAPEYHFVTRPFMARMKKKGYDVDVWTVNDPARMKRLAKKGVHALITDRPDVALSLSL